MSAGACWDHRGNLPLDASLSLRLSLKAQSVGDDVGPLASATQRLLRFPLFCPSPNTKLQRNSEFCFYMQQLQRDLLLGPKFEVTDLAGFVAHIFWQQPGNFALVALLHAKDLMKKICEGPREVLVSILCRFFGRRLLPKWQVRKLTMIRRRRPGSSLVVLPKLPGDVESVLQQHSDDVLKALVHHLSSFIKACAEDLEPCDQLPLTGSRPCPAAVTPSPARLRSPFVALSGHGDDFGSFAELCDTLREDLRIDESMRLGCFGTESLRASE